MTIPSRPAPAPPGSRGQNAAAGANASLEQLRMQLQQQQQQQQQNGGIQKMTIKLPPPPRGPNGAQGVLRNANSNIVNGSSITRKFPQARYAPATNWDDSPFDAAANATNGNTKKVPPPRPPPPKVQVINNNGGRKATAPTAPLTRPPTQTASILTNIFNRKKSTKAPATSGASRVYGVSSGVNYGSTTTPSNFNASTTNIRSNSYYATNSNGAADWNACWNNTIANSSSYTTISNTNSTINSSNDAQLISFDSPPSSPTFTQKSNSDCVSVDSFSSDSNFSSPNNGSVSQPESGFEDDFTRSRPPTVSPLDPWETTFDTFGASVGDAIGTAPVRNLNSINTRIQANNDNPLCNGKSLLPPAPSLTMPTIIKPKISQKPKAPKPPPMGAFQFQHSTSVFDADLPTPPSPPMPYGAPPPAPTLLDVIAGRADALQLSAATGSSYAETEKSDPAYGLALYDFDGAEEGDLSFRENEKIYLLEQVSEEWYRGRTRAGCEGIFPVNYIDIKIPLEAVPAAPAAAIIAGPSYQQQSGFKNLSSAIRVRCLYNFPAEVAGDLALKENDLVTVLYKINDEWLYGQVDGRQGQFPSNFLEYVPANIPMP